MSIMKAKLKTTCSAACLTASMLMGGAINAHAEVDEQAEYGLIYLQQHFDGAEEVSYMHNAVIERVRDGAESYARIDYGDGAIVVTDAYGFSASPIINTSDDEASFHYDYRDQQLKGINASGSYFNTYVRPHLNKSPKLGADAQWSANLSMAALGFDALKDMPFSITLERDYFEHDGRQFVAVKYQVPAFEYEVADGRMAIHWADGLLVANPSFGEIYLTVSAHNSTLAQASGGTRPYTFNRALIAVDANGAPLIDPAAMAPVKASYEQLFITSVEDTQPFIRTEYTPDRTPLSLSSLIDIFALSLGENSANKSGEIIGETHFGTNGQIYGSYVDVALDGVNQIRKQIKNRKLILTADKSFAISDRLSKGMTQIEALANRSVTVRQSMENGRKLIDANQTLLKSLTTEYLNLVDNADDVDTIFGPKAKSLADRIKSLTNSTQSAIQQMDKLGKEMTTLAKMAEKSQQLINAVKDIKAVQIVSSGASKLAKGVDEFLKKGAVKNVTNGLSFLFNTDKAIKNSYNLGNFDATKVGGNPTADLELSLDYSNYGDLTSDLGWALFSIATDAASVKKGPTSGWGGKSLLQAKLAYGTLVFASNVATDYYKLSLWGDVVEQQNKQAQQEYLLLLKKQIKQNKEQFGLLQATNTGLYQKFPSDLSPKQVLGKYFERQPDGTYVQIKTYDPYEGGYNVKDDIRVDPDTGLPTPGFWEYLKKSPAGRAILVRDFGIDPDAPVGTPPGTNWRGEGEGDDVASNDPPTTGGGDNYPKYDPEKDPNKNKGKDDETTPPGGPYGNPAAEAAAEAMRVIDEMIADLTSAFEAAAEDEETEEQSDLLAAFFDGELPLSPWYSPPGTTSPLVLSTLYTSKFDVVPVNFDMPKWVPPTWKPPKWVPPTFDGPDGSQITLRPFGGDDSWPQGSDWLAFDYFGLDDPERKKKGTAGGLSGIVQTDLGPWEEWLETQDRRKLERLAVQAGYPNLAAALANARQLIRWADDPGFRKWAMTQPACGGYVGCGPPGALQGLWTQKRSQLALGDILADSRDLFSTAGLSDIGISGTTLSYFLSDFGIEDGDIVDVEVTQFTRTVFSQRVNLTNAGQRFDIGLNPGVATVNIEAVNEGALSPNTAAINIFNISQGDDNQDYSLRTGERAVLRVAVGQQPGS